MSVLKQLRALMPYKNYIYVADEKYCPYGIREDNYIVERITKICRFLKEFEPEIIVIACNTASRFADVVKQVCGVITVGVIAPTVRYISDIQSIRNCLLLATTSTVNGNIYSGLLSESGIMCKSVACDFIVELVEALSLPTDFNKFVRTKFSQLNFSDYDAMVLGCTHFDFALPYFKKLLPENMRVISCGFPTAQAVKNFCTANNQRDDGGKVYVYTTSLADTFKSKLDFYSLAADFVYHADID